MKLKSKFLQQGGQMPQEQTPQNAQQGAPQEGQASPEDQIAMMAQEIVNQLGPEGAALLAQAIMSILQQAPQQAPAYARKGGKLVRIG
jgi:hypothetical protein